MFHFAIDDINWDRVQLTISVNLSAGQLNNPESESCLKTDYFKHFQHRNNPDCDTPFFLIKITKKNNFNPDAKIIPLKKTYIYKKSAQIHINIVNLYKQKPLQEGRYVIAIYQDGMLIPATIDPHLKLRDKSLVYLYNNDTASYIIGFELSEDDHYPVIIMKVFKMKVNISLETIKYNIVNIGVKVATSLITFTNKFIGNKKNRVLFASNRSAILDGNLQCIYEKIVERNLDNLFSCDFFLTNKKISSLSPLKIALLFYKMIRCEYILIDDYFPPTLLFSTNTGKRIIQVWHAGSGFKSVGYSRFGMVNAPDLYTSAHRRYTHTIVGSKNLIPEYAEAFGVDEETVIPSGLPRIDRFLDKNSSKKIKSRLYRDYPGFKDKKIILFAPTFRGRGKKDAFYHYEKINFKALANFCGRKYNVIFKMHPFITTHVPIPEKYKEIFIDMTSYPNINELLQITDILITDYSSVIYEYSLLKRPILFFAYDRKLYAESRGFHLDYATTAPGKICDTFDELINALKKKDYEINKVKKYVKENFDCLDNKSSDRFIDWLLLGKTPEKNK